MLNEEEKQRVKVFVEKNKEKTLELVKKLAAIPAPSHHEERKADFVKKWMEDQGAEGVFIDEACNVIFPYGCDGEKEIVVFMAHTDVVFPDLEPFMVMEDEEKLYAPGIKDDNADLANLLMCVKYLLEYRPVMSAGILFVANSCEEGLGNLKGSKQIYEDYKERIKECISFDGNLDAVVNRAVGSQRYRVSVKTEGGHSYGAFGNDNAIYELARIIQSLYAIQVPTKAKTTYNVGKIEGGTSINTIAQSASMLYEFRSEDRVCLKTMEDAFEKVIDEYRANGLDVTVEVMGIRPCGKDVDEKALDELTQRHVKIIRQFTEREVMVGAGSTDANTFLARGIPANVIGTAIGGKTHTREEWIRKDSLITGQKIGLASVLWYQI